MVEHLVDLTAAAAELIDAHSELELLVPPSTITVLFRCRAADDANVKIQRALFDSGRAVIGRTRHDGRVALKLTLVNPQISRADLARLLDLIVSEAADQREAELV